jgi:hypothetical protein
MSFCNGFYAFLEFSLAHIDIVLSWLIILLICASNFTAAFYICSNFVVYCKPST